jgi:hypothetical protein
MAFVAIQSQVLALDVPIGVKEQEITAIYEPAPNPGGGYRPDGSDAWDYCIDSGCYYNPQVGDRVKVDAVQGWRMTFWNVGEMGGETKKMAKLEQVREFLNAGETVTEVVPPIGGEDSFKSGIIYSKIISTPANDIMEPYINPKYTFSLGFTGGPNGVFWEINGERQHPNGKEIRGDVKKGDDGLYYIQMSGAFNAQLKIDDPKVFDGFVESWDNANVIWEGGYSYGFSDYGGEVWVETSDGEASPAIDFAAEKGQQITEGMIVKTGTDSYAVIILNSAGSKLVVGPNSQVKMKRPETGFFDTNMGRMILKVKRNVELMIYEGRMEVIMNQAVAGRKGTVAVFVEEPEISTVKVLEGEMYLKSNISGESKDIAAGQMLSADKNGLGELTEIDIEQELKSWEEMVPKAVVDDVRQTITENETAGKTGWWSASYLWYVLIGLGLIVMVAVIILVTVFKKKKVN